MQKISSQPFQRIDDLFTQTVEQYLPLIDTISIQTKLIQKLQNDHKRLTKKCQEISSKNKLDKNMEESIREKNSADLKNQKQIFLEEALNTKQHDYEKQYESKKEQVLEQIFLKYQQICLLRENRQNSTNLFTHLNDELFGNKNKQT